MDLPANHFTHILTNFALVGIPEPPRALREMYRVLRPSGITAFSIWKTVGWFDITGAAVASIPGAPRYPTYEEFIAMLMKDSQPEGKSWIKLLFEASALSRMINHSSL